MGKHKKTGVPYTSGGNTNYQGETALQQQSSLESLQKGSWVDSSILLTLFTGFVNVLVSYSSSEKYGNKCGFELN